jgi:Endomembrane protein 70
LCFSDQVSHRYSGGIPVGISAHELANGEFQGLRYNLSSYPPEASFVYNHWNIDILYQEVDTFYYIVGFTIQPFSVTQFNSATGEALLPSCSAAGKLSHTDYAMLSSFPMQPLTGTSKVFFTYDVKWTKTRIELNLSNRWSEFLSRNKFQSIQTFNLLVGFGLGLIILIALIGALAPWWIWI